MYKYMYRCIYNSVFHVGRNEQKLEGTERKKNILINVKLKDSRNFYKDLTMLIVAST